jgi:hypothetical protein
MYNPRINRLARSFLMLAGVVLITTVFGQDVQATDANIWCRRDFGRDNAVCAFGTLEQCMSAAVISGGICERDRRNDASSKPCVSSRSAGARRAAGASCNAG